MCSSEKDRTPEILVKSQNYAQTRKTTDWDQNLIKFEGGQDTSAY